MSYTPYKPRIVDEKYTYLQHNHPPKLDDSASRS